MQVPNSWKDVTLKTYIEITEISAVDMDELDKQVKILSVLTGKPESFFLDLPIPDLKKCINATSFLKTLSCPVGSPRFVKLNGQRFKINTDVRKLTGGEFIAYSKWTEDQDTITKNLPDILSLFLKPVYLFGIPKFKSYYKNDKGHRVQTVESMERNRKLILEHLPMDKVIQLSSFFLRNSMALSDAIHRYLIQEQKKKLKIVNKNLQKVKRDLSNNGAGSTR